MDFTAVTFLQQQRYQDNVNQEVWNICNGQWILWENIQSSQQVLSFKNVQENKTHWTIAVLTKATAHLPNVKPAIFEAASDSLVPQPTCWSFSKSDGDPVYPVISSYQPSPNQLLLNIYKMHQTLSMNKHVVPPSLWWPSSEFTKKRNILTISHVQKVMFFSFFDVGRS